MDAVKSYRVALDELDQYYNWRRRLAFEKKSQEKQDRLSAEEKLANLRKHKAEMAKKKAEKRKENKERNNR